MKPWVLWMMYLAPFPAAGTSCSITWAYPIYQDSFPAGWYAQGSFVATCDRVTATGMGEWAWEWFPLGVDPRKS